MKNDLIDRYIYAVTKRMNPKIREDVKKELYSLVDDMLTERCGDVAPTEKDIRVVLTELGTPQEVYAKYDEDGNKCLIGQPYYSTYKAVLKAGFGGVAIGLTIACLILQVLESQPWLDAIGNWLSTLCDGLLSLFAVVTVVFAVMERKGMKLQESFNLDDLPAVPKKKQEISRGDCIFSIVFCVVLMTVLLAAPQYIAGYWSDGAVIPVFDVQVLQGSWYLILIFGLADIARSVIRMLEGRYNRKVLTATCVSNVIVALSAALWLTRSDLINPEFVTHVQAAMADEALFIQNIFTHFDSFLLAVILLALVLDTIEAAVKTLKK